MQKKRIDVLKEECDKLDISLIELFREAKLPNNIIQHWSVKDPKSIQILDKLTETLEVIRQRKTEAVNQ